MQALTNLTGDILLQRKNKDYLAGYCVMREELPRLLQYLSNLHPTEMELFNTLRIDRRRISYLLGRMAAKKAIAEIARLDELHSIFIDTGVFQFPVVKSSRSQNIQVSISHCDHLGIALAFPEEHPLGVDVEKIETGKMEAIKDYTSDAEYQLLLNCGLPTSTGLTVLWTIKEGLSKILRTGLTMEIKLLEVQHIEEVNGCYTSTFCNLMQYKSISYVSGNYVCSIVLPRHTTASFDGFRRAFAHLTLNNL